MAPDPVVVAGYSAEPAAAAGGVRFLCLSSTIRAFSAFRLTPVRRDALAEEAESGSELTGDGVRDGVETDLDISTREKKRK